MPGASRVNVDKAGGTIVGNLAPTVFVNNQPIAVKGAAVEGHGRSPHSSPVMRDSSADVFAHNIGVVRAGDTATCGDAATGSSDVFVN